MNRSYEINRSNVFRVVLEHKGFREANYDEKPDFSYSTRPEGKIRNLPVTITSRYCNKRQFYKLLQRQGQISDLPDTYLSLTALPPKITGVWFVKESVGSRGEAVYCCRSRSDIVREVSRLRPDSYVIQKGVERLDLLDQRKYTLRVYLVHLGDGRVFVYHRIVAIRHSQPYDQNSPDHNVHVDHKEAERFDLATVHPQFELLFERILDVCARNFRCFRREIDMAGTAYHLYGLDFLIDQDHRPWFIEMNGFPNVSSAVDDPREGILVELFYDLYDLVLTPEQRPGKFVLALETE